jgi:hypothetical protein
MAIIFEGLTECHICKQVLQAGDEITAFPAFLKNTHPLWEYSDAAMHTRCYEACPDKPEMDRLYARFREIWDSRPLGATWEEIEEWGRTAFLEFG